MGPSIGAYFQVGPFSVENQWKITDGPITHSYTTLNAFWSANFNISIRLKGSTRQKT